MKFKNHFTWRFEGITHFGEFVPLNDFDKTEYKHVQLKDNEFLSRYKTDVMHGRMAPLIKINLKSQRVYFLQSSPDSDRAWFDGKGIPAKIHVEA
tara:strand:+ start:217 stop:501 length:285 start_codon:yes stop_codon:yes gene_type:complete